MPFLGDPNHPRPRIHLYQQIVLAGYHPQHTPQRFLLRLLHETCSCMRVTILIYISAVWVQWHSTGTAQASVRAAQPFTHVLQATHYAANPLAASTPNPQRKP